MIVVDASVAVKWLIPESGEEAAKSLLAGRLSLVAPALIRLEVAGALLRAFRENRLSQESARAAIDAWHQMLEEGNLQLIPDSDLYASAIEIGFKLRHALVDCLYLAAAKATRMPLVTADRKLAERGGKVVPEIRLLGSVHAG